MVGEGEFRNALSRLERVVLDACAAEEEWPAKIAAGVYAGVDFVIANPGVARSLAIDPSSSAGFKKRYEVVVGRLAGFIQVEAPAGARLSQQTGEALVGGMVGLVGDHLRVGRVDRLARLRPELVLLALLPYMAFEEAQRWSNWAAGESG
jgi:hypothetical protein